MQDYLFLTVGIVGGACSDVKQDFLEVDGKRKRSQLETILSDPARDPKERILIFVQTKKNADFLGTKEQCLTLILTAMDFKEPHFENRK
jgi:probable ATP-dependent RNA helicase DDX4